jgi:hypothetical protein
MAAASTITSAAAAGRRRAHFAARSQSGVRRARIGSPAWKRRKSPASSRALSYRLRGCFSRHFRQMVSRSRGTWSRNRLGGTGSSESTWSTVAMGVSALSGGRPVSVS